MRRHVATGRESSIDVDGALSTLPSALNGNYSWIGAQSVWVDGDEVIVGWVDDNRHVRIARRLYRRPFEASVDLFSATGTVFGQQVTLDSHNTISVAKDDAGFYHVSGDMHAVALKYMRSSAPGRLDSWTSGMVGTLEASATYPQFVKAKSGVLYFWYRDGSSGDGNWVLNKCSTATGAPVWTRVTTVLQGSVENVSAYPQNIAVDPTTGRWHMLWTIRDDFSSDATNHDIFYAYSDDEGVSWNKTDGTPYVLPILGLTGEVVQSLPGGAAGDRTLINGGSTAVNPSGKPESVWLLESGVGTGVYHYRHLWLDGSNVWHWDAPFGTTNSSGRVPALHIWPDGRRWMFFQNGAGGRGNTLRYLDLDTSTETVVRNANMIQHTPVIRHSREREVLYVLAPKERQAGAQGGDPADLGAQLAVPVIALR